MKLSHPAVNSIYLAAPYRRKEEIKTYAVELERAGIRVTSRWLNEPYDDPVGMGPEELARLCAAYDLEDIDRSRYVLSFTEPPESIVPRGGRHVEFGYALAKGKGVGVVGYRENIFHALPQVEFFETFADALYTLSHFSKYPVAVLSTQRKLKFQDA